MTKLGPYEVHPFADAFPLIEGEEFEELVNDIKTHGLRQPIVLNHDRTVLIDGRNRYRACMAAGVDPVFETLPERDHPRVRGEHPGLELLEDRDRGSSPRARGARDRRRSIRSTMGIIPACAGSTHVAAG